MDAITERYKGSGYGQFKGDLADVVVNTLEPIQKRYQELVEPGVIEKILEDGRKKAEPLAMRTLGKFQKKLGMVPRLRE